MNTNLIFVLIASTICFLDRADGKYFSLRNSEVDGKTPAEVYHSIKVAIQKVETGIDALDLNKLAKSVHSYADLRTAEVSTEDIEKEIVDAAGKVQLPANILDSLINQDHDSEKLQTLSQKIDGALKIWGALADKAETAYDDTKILAATGKIARSLINLLKSTVTEIVFQAAKNTDKVTDGTASIVYNRLKEARELSPNSRIKRGGSLCANLLIISGCLTWG